MGFATTRKLTRIVNYNFSWYDTNSYSIYTIKECNHYWASFADFIIELIFSTANKTTVQLPDSHYNSYNAYT